MAAVTADPVMAETVAAEDMAETEMEDSGESAVFNF